MDPVAKAHILIVDDSSQIRKFLRICLNAHGFEVLEAARGEDAIRTCAIDHPDLVILDLGLPDVDGQQVIQRIREWSRIPILVLSIRAGETDKVRSLENGANDYVTKPFGVAELLARIGVLLRNRPERGAEDETTFESDALTIDYAARQVKVNGRDVFLTRKEFDVLRLLSRQAGKVLTHEQLLSQVWGSNTVNEAHSLRVHVGHLRQKLGDDPNAPRFIWTEPGVGYRLMIGG